MPFSRFPLFQPNISLPTVSFHRAQRNQSWFRYKSKYLSKWPDLNSANFSLSLSSIFLTSYFREGFPLAHPPPHSMLLQFLETIRPVLCSLVETALSSWYCHPNVVKVNGQLDRIWNHLGDRHRAMCEGLYPSYLHWCGWICLDGSGLFHGPGVLDSAFFLLDCGGNVNSTSKLLGAVPKEWARINLFPLQLLLSQ